MGQQFNDVADLVIDQGFLDWNQGISSEEAENFIKWMESAQVNKDLALEGQHLLTTILLKEKPVPDEQVLAAKKRLDTALGEDKKVIRMGKWANRWWWAAAMVLLLLGAGKIWNQRNEAPKREIASGFGELREHELPDGSLVTLNANSHIELGKGFVEKEEREVWLKGEAFFHVKKTADHKRFIVHTDRFDIIVTGTQFNVVNRGDKTNVLLTEGSVFLRLKDGKEIEMVPGEFVELTGDQEATKKNVEQDKILAWKDRILIFDNTPLPEAAQQITDQYGVKIQIADKALADTATVSGIVPIDNLDKLLELLAEGNKLQVRRENGVIIFDKKSR